MKKEKNRMAFQMIRKNLGEIKGTCSVVIISWVTTFIWIILRANLSINYRPVLDTFCYAGIILAVAFNSAVVIIHPTRQTLRRTKIALAFIVVMLFLSAIVLANASWPKKLFISTAMCLFILICAYIHLKFKRWIFAKCIKRVSVQGVTGRVFSLVWELIEEEQLSWFHEGESHMNYLLCERKASGKTMFCQDYVKCLSWKYPSQNIFIYDYCFEKEDCCLHNYDHLAGEWYPQVKILHIPKLHDFLNYVLDETVHNSPKVPVTVVIDSWSLPSDAPEGIIIQLLSLPPQVTVLLVTESLESLSADLLSEMMKHFVLIDPYHYRIQ